MSESKYLSPEQVAEMKEVFNIFDVDGDNTISTKELGKVMNSLGQNPNEAELRELIQEYDNDGNGTLDFPEFLELMAKKLKQIDTEEELVEAFKIFDRDQDGLLTKSDLKNIFKILGEQVDEEYIEKLITLADQDGDESINFVEFCKMMTQHRYKERNE